MESKHSPSSCIQCGNGVTNELVCFSEQPISNRFLKRADEAEDHFAIDLRQCPSCALIQLAQPISFRELKPRVDWITYNEPEDHLDRLAEILAGLPGLDGHSKVLGVTFKDDTLLARLKRMGFANTYRIKPDEDLGISEPGIGAETIQHHITAATAQKLVSKFGAADLVIVRHVLEHAHDYLEFCKGLKGMMRQGAKSYLVVEIPDCSKALSNGDATMVWEEHTLYFTETTLRRSLEHMGLRVEGFHVYPYALEDSLVAICTISEASTRVGSDLEALVTELKLGRTYSEKVNRAGEAWRKFLEDHKSAGKTLAMFGAGHLTCAFLNFFGFERYFDFVADDNPNKKGLFMPGSKLPILGSSALEEKKVDVCVMGLAPTSEPKIAQKYSELTARGGRFVSILPNSEFFPLGGSKLSI